MLQLKELFKGVSAKSLSAVEAKRERSNQHELNGTSAMREYLGNERALLETRFLYLGHDEEDRLSLNDEVTWYDGRAGNPNRAPEFRLYFRDNEVMSRATEGDVVITAFRHDGTLLMLVISEENPALGELLWLFEIGEQPRTKFKTVDLDRKQSLPSSLFHFISEEAGLELHGDVDDDWLDLLLDRFGPSYPSTREMSALALETLKGEMSPIDEPDETLLGLMDREDALFRQLEAHIVSREISDRADSWPEDVPSFIKFSLGVQNRRKTRAGHALENHLQWIFQENKLLFEKGVRTESRSKPDFLFPGQREYRDPCFPTGKLTMLGVKTTCKDRWRQVLNEAHRIPHKHLLTLQPAITEYQTREMAAAGVSLVLPKPLQHTFTPGQRATLLELGEFIAHVEEQVR